MHAHLRQNLLGRLRRQRSTAQLIWVTLTTLAELEVLGKRCNHPYRHVPAAGSARVHTGSGFKWVARTTLAGACPALGWHTVLPATLQRDPKLLQR